MTKISSNGSMWFFITWHEGITRLQRLLSLLHSAGNTYVVSIGGLRLPPDLEILSTLLLLDGTHFLLRQPVTWGGQKLLFHNLIEVAEHFERQTPPGSWLQVLCHRSFPLIGPLAMKERLRDEAFTATWSKWHHPSTAAWYEEWPTDVVERLPEVYQAALEEVYSTASVSTLMTLDQYNTGYQSFFEPFDSQSYNFSAKAEPMAINVGDHLHKYMISPFSVDARWMSFARLNEFIDTAAENGSTYSRRAHPIDVKWRHSILKKYDLRSGDPFITASKKYVDTLLNDPRSHELFAAMSPAFCPEMNMLDTLTHSSCFALKEEMIHTFYRNDDQTCRDAEIPDAEQASSSEGCFFVRKTLSQGSQDFIEHFAAKVELEWGDVEYLAIPIGQAHGVQAILPGVVAVLDLIPANSRALLRNLKGELLGEYCFQKNHRLTSEENSVGWSTEEDCLTLSFPWGERSYRSVSADGRRLIFAPAGIVSRSTEWGIFLEIEMEPEEPADTIIVEHHLDTAAEAGIKSWGSRSKAVALMRALEATDDPYYPMPVGPREVSLDQLSGDGERFSFTYEERRYEAVQIAYAAGQAIAIAALTDPMTISAPRALRARDLCGEVEISVLGSIITISLRADGIIRSKAGDDLGVWIAKPSEIWLIGIPGLRVARVGQFLWDDGRWKLSGWAWKNFKDAVTFSLATLPDA